MRFRILQRVARFGGRRHDAGAKNAQALRRVQQPKLDRVPIEPGQVVQPAQTQGAQPSLAISLHVVGEDRIGQHRHMAEHVMENVRLLQIVKLIGAADKSARGKTAVGQVRVEYLVWNQPGHGNHTPAGERGQPVR